MKTYARIFEGQVQELFSTDGDIASMFHPEMVWIDVTEMETKPTVGWAASKSSSGWALSAPTVLPKSQAEMKADVIAQRDVLLDLANEATAGMSDAFVAGLLDAVDTAKFKAYAAYKLALNKIDIQQGFPETIVWPITPRIDHEK